MLKLKRCLLILLLIFFTAVPQVMATTNGLAISSPPAGVTNTDLAGIIVNVTNWVLGFVVLSFLVLVIYGAVTYMTSSGDSGGTESAKNIMVYSILGLMLCGIAYAIVQVVVRVWIQGNFA